MSDSVRSSRRRKCYRSISRRSSNRLWNKWDNLMQRLTRRSLTEAMLSRLKIPGTERLKSIPLSRFRMSTKGVKTWCNCHLRKIFSRSSSNGKTVVAESHHSTHNSQNIGANQSRNRPLTIRTNGNRVSFTQLPSAPTLTLKRSTKMRKLPARTSTTNLW